MKIIHSSLRASRAGSVAADAPRPFGIEIQYLLAFLAVYEARNVTTAARRIHRSQSAISHSLSKMRALMGDELFVVRGGEMQPTALGEALYPTIAQAVSLIDSLRGRQRGFDAQRDSFDLRIGMTDYEEQLLSPRLWMEIERRTPGVRLVVRSINRYAAEPMVLSGALDLAIVGNPVCRHPDLECRVLLSEPYVVACSQEVELPALTLERYLQADHLSVEVGSEQFGSVDEALRAIGCARRVRCVVPTYSRVPDLLRHSTLFATHSQGVFLRDAAAHEGLQLHAPPFELAPVQIGMVALRHAKASGAQRWACDLVHALVSRPHGAGLTRPRPRTQSGRAA
ncbi:LysR family transcriptional regulator [Variovorax sp. PBL-E5]|uniref:LysR family transcriptional regulator n=1 Tax=Variovorax sp. PBL-E5 TaxID=434014 RepID=UPI001315C75C|nr:LysR family transcriptional regulator [Variovorax sp. PBL-E5]VTU17440.1 Nodulation protein D 2 [Variovorax sp. PBL-E5]